MLSDMCPRSLPPRRRRPARGCGSVVASGPRCLRSSHHGSAAVAASRDAFLRRAAALLIVAASFSPAKATAQTLSGQVLEEGRNAPVAGAVISLVDQNGRHRAEATSDSLGRFLLAPPEAGEYVVEAVRLGYATTRSPLFALAVEGVVPFEIMMRPNPIGLEGFEVSVEREAEILLGPFGLTPATLGRRWIGRDDIAKMTTPGLPKDLIRRQGIPGLWVDEYDPGSGLKLDLCVRFRRRVRQCALTVLNGAVIPLSQAFRVDPRDIEAIAILTPLDATTFYGTAAGGGAVLIWTRSGRR